MALNSAYDFRLSAPASPGAPVCVFSAARAQFREAVGSALIDIRLREPARPLKLEIALMTKGKIEWVPLPPRVNFPGGNLPSDKNIRWGCIADAHEYLVKAREDLIVSRAPSFAPAVAAN